jgi:hypothetical protein
MLNFFNFISKAIMWFFSFGGNTANFFTSFARFGVFRAALKYMIFSLTLALLVLMIATSLAFFYFLVDSIIRIYNLFSTIIHLYSSYSSSSDASVSSFFYFMKLLGITDAFNAVFPFISLALTFILLKALFKALRGLVSSFYKVALFVVSSV